MNQKLYSLLTYILLPIAILKLLKNNKTKRISERFGFIKEQKDKVIWIHCVSVGEFKAAIVLINEMIEKYPNNKILITTTTKTGSNIVNKHYKNKVLHFYFPFDCPFFIKRFIDKANPKMVLIMETEIWANLIYYLNKKQIPTLIVNARLSQKSFEKYQRFASFSKKTLNKLTLILAQDDASKARFIKLGVSNKKVKNVGNIKFDQDLAIDKNQKKILTDKRKVVVFASTHRGEEELIIKSYLKYKNDLNALIVIVPRHPERFDEVFKLIKQNNIQLIKRSDMKPSNNYEILLGDSIGEMMMYFNVADIVFMGGSLNNTGGHNMLEPAALAKPILFGPNVFNFTKITTDLINKNGAIQVKNSDKLFKTITILLKDDKKRKTLGENAQKYLSSKQGVIKKITQIIQDLNLDN